MKHTVTKLGEEDESANSILGNYLIELELRHPASEEADNITDTQLDLLQCSRADEIDCKIADVVFDNG